ESSFTSAARPSRRLARVEPTREFEPFAAAGAGARLPAGSRRRAGGAARSTSFRRARGARQLDGTPRIDRTGSSTGAQGGPDIDHRLKAGGHRGWSSGPSADLAAPLVRLDLAWQSGQWGHSGDRGHHPAPGRLFSARESVNLLFASNGSVMATQDFCAVDPGASTIVLFFSGSTIFLRPL